MCDECVVHRSVCINRTAVAAGAADFEMLCEGAVVEFKGLLTWNNGWNCVCFVFEVQDL